MKRWFIGAAVMLVAVGVSAAYAAIPSADGTISGCYEKRTGILRVIDAEAGRQCLSWENAIGWNARGPQGPQGETGLSEAYFRSGSLALDAGEFGDVVSVELPAGLYAVTATGQVENPGAAGSACELIGTAPSDTAGFTTSADVDFLSLALSGVATVTEPRTVRVTCFSNDNGIRAQVRLIALKVGALE